MTQKILIVDDEPDIVKVLAARLKERGYDVTVAAGGQEGLMKAGRQSPDLIILDIMMPDMDGSEVAARLKQIPATAKIPIIFLSALQTKKEEKEGSAMISGNVVMAKPYDIDVLCAKIREMI